VIGVSRVFVITDENEHCVLPHRHASNNELFVWCASVCLVALLLLLVAAQLYRCIYRVHSRAGAKVDALGRGEHAEQIL
jgi:hypothetical protein